MTVIIETTLAISTNKNTELAHRKERAMAEEIDKCASEGVTDVDVVRARVSAAARSVKS